MPRVPPLLDEQASPDLRDKLEQIRARFGRVTNLKRTLAHSPLALQAFLQWHDLRDEVSKFVGARGVTIFAYAISTTTNCLICSTFFRRALMEVGTDPEKLLLDERDQALLEFGRQLARNANAVPDELFARLHAFLTPAQLVTLTAFGGMMVATNIFNNALRVELDDYLHPYQQ